MTQALRLGIAGLGTVGASVVRMLARRAEAISASAGRPVQVTAVAARDQRLTAQRPAGLSDQAWTVLAAALAFDPALRPADAGAFQRAFYSTPPPVG